MPKDPLASDADDWSELDRVMSEARENSAISAAPGIPGQSLLWLVLGISYLVASATGYRGIALGVVGLMIGVLLAKSVTNCVANSAANSSAACGRRVRVAGLLAGMVLASAGVYWSDSLFLVVYLPPIAGFAFMAFFFQRTLWRGSEPLITRVARKEHPDLPADIARYTRTLTWAWSGCFVSLCAAALMLAPVLSLDSWSRWVQALGIAVPGLLFLGEYIYRHHRLRKHRHGSLPVLIFNTIAVVKEAAGWPAPAIPGNPANIKRQ